MRNANQKGRCVKRALPKFTSVCRTFDVVQQVYAEKLSANEDIADVKCNVSIDDTSEGQFTTDFVITKKDGSVAVRECVLRSNALRPRMIKLLDFSQRYWLKKSLFYNIRNLLKTCVYSW